MRLTMIKLPEPAKSQVEAVKGIKNDKVTASGGHGEGKNGQKMPPHFTSSPMGVVFPLPNRKGSRTGKG